MVTTDTIAALNDLANDFFVAEASRNPAAGTYWASRGLAPATVEAWRLGYAPRSGCALLAHLGSFGWSEVTAVGAGLARVVGGHIVAAFRDRHTMPILASDGETVLGFTARAVSDDPAVPKYLNSPTTALFRKGQEAYGWPNADAIVAAGEVLVVEGPVDMLALWNAGVCNVLALCGTALTPELLTKLAALAPRITLVLDDDEAGRAASVRGLLLPGAASVDLGVIPLAGGKDPAEIMRTDPGRWPELTARRRSRWGHLWAVTLAPYRELIASDVEARISWKDAWAALVRDHAVNRADGKRLLAPLAERLGIPLVLFEDEFLGRLP